MRNSIWQLLTAAVLAFAFGAAPSFAADPYPGVYALKADNGKFLARCDGCVTGAAYSDNAGVHESATSSGWARWTVEKLANGKWSLKSVDSGKFLARCENCAPGIFPNSAFVHVADASKAYAQWTLTQQSGGKYVLQADNGLYLARCKSCFKTSAITDSAFVSEKSASAAAAQWSFVAIDVKAPTSTTTSQIGKGPLPTSQNCATVTLDQGKPETLTTDQTKPGTLTPENDGSAPLITDQTC